MDFGRRILTTTSLAVLVLLMLAALSCEEEEPAPAATPTPAARATPTGTGIPPMATPVVAAPGAVAESAGVRVTLTEISDPWSSYPRDHPTPSPGKRYVRFDFVLENVGATGTVGAFGLGFKLVDAEGFVCDGGVGAETGASLAEGEKTRAWLVFQCDQGAALALLTVDGLGFRFE